MFYDCIPITASSGSRAAQESLVDNSFFALRISITLVLVAKCLLASVNRKQHGNISGDPIIIDSDEPKVHKTINCLTPEDIQYQMYLKNSMDLTYLNNINFCYLILCWEVST